MARLREAVMNAADLATSLYIFIMFQSQSAFSRFVSMANRLSPLRHSNYPKHQWQLVHRPSPTNTCSLNSGHRAEQGCLVL